MHTRQGENTRADLWRIWKLNCNFEHYFQLTICLQIIEILYCNYTVIFYEAGFFFFFANVDEILWSNRALQDEFLFSFAILVTPLCSCLAFFSAYLIASGHLEIKTMYKSSIKI